MAVLVCEARNETWWNNGEFFAQAGTYVRPRGIPEGILYTRPLPHQVIRVTVDNYFTKISKVQNRSRSKRRLYSKKRYTKRLFTDVAWHELEVVGPRRPLVASGGTCAPCNPIYAGASRLTAATLGSAGVFGQQQVSGPSQNLTAGTIQKLWIDGHGINGDIISGP